jgi:uncharacterized phiE125 gp8 family phage protein
MGLRLVTPPEVEPITLEEAKTHLRLDSDADDAYVSALITAARERVELFLRRALITQVFELTLDHFPHGMRSSNIPRPPIQEVEHVKYIDTSGIVQTLPPETYAVDTSSNEIGRIALAWNRFWPIARCSINAVVIRFVAGYGDAPGDVPQAIRHGILIEVSNLYENREDVVVGQAVNMMAVSERLLWPYRALGAE